MPKAFLSYLRDDSKQVDCLAAALRCNGVEVWLDRDDIEPGKRWQDSIRTAIHTGSFFLACFSSSYAQRAKSYMNEELNLAIEELRLRPADSVWFIPILIDECEIPDVSVRAGETIRSLQAVSLFSDWTAAVLQLLKVLSPEEHTGTSVPPLAVISSIEGAINQFGKALHEVHFPLTIFGALCLDSKMFGPNRRSEFSEIIDNGLSALKRDVASIQSMPVRRGDEDEQKRIIELADIVTAIQWHGAAIVELFEKDEGEEIFGTVMPGIVFLVRGIRQLQADAIQAHRI